MLDVLVAIVVLATGLLALAALQGALTRNGADARARSQMAAYTESLVDRMRFAGYTTAAPSTTFAAGDTITPSSSCSGSLTLKQTMQCDANTVQNAAGVSNLTTTITTAQLYCGTSGSTFAAASSCTGNQANYKQLKLTTTWTDATGSLRSLSMDTAVSPVTLDTGNTTLANSTFNQPTGTGPVVRQTDPGSTLGVIPIAVSSTQDAAATNPKPVVTDTGTTFSTLTYSASASSLGGNIIAERVDTKVIQCGCGFAGATGVGITADNNLESTSGGNSAVFKQPMGPTYWDGSKYTTPLAVPGTTSSTASTTGVVTAATQDQSCDICCRDRNDGVGNVDALGNSILFDNHSGLTTKYQYVSGVLTAVNTGTFVQACRMIRVNGTYAVATDAHDYFSVSCPQTTVQRKARRLHPPIALQILLSATRFPV